MLKTLRGVVARWQSRRRKKREAVPHRNRNAPRVGNDGGRVRAPGDDTPSPGPWLL